MASKVTVVIPTAQRQDLLRECLASLQKQTFRDFETIVVADAAGPWAEALAAEFGCTLLRNPSQAGFACSVNRGIAASSSPYIMLLNDDVRLDPSWLETATAFLEEHSEYAFCCGKIFGLDGHTIDNAGDAISKGGSAWRLGHGRRDLAPFDAGRPILAFPGTAALVRNSLFDIAGTLDETFFAYLEDADLSLRAARMGMRGYYLPQATCVHQGGATSGGPRTPMVFRLLTQNQLLLVTKNFPRQALLLWAPRIVWAQLLWAGMAIRKGLMGAYLAGWMGFLRRCSSTIRLRKPCSNNELRDWMALLETSEAEIFADTQAPGRSVKDTFWRLYFLLFSPASHEKKNVSVEPRADAATRVIKR